MVKYGIWAERTAASMFGAAGAWAKRDGIPVTFDTEQEAADQAKAWNASRGTANVYYTAERMGA